MNAVRCPQSAGRVAPRPSAGRVVHRPSAGRVVPRPSAGRVVHRPSAGRVVPREERAGHVSRPQPSPHRPSPDLDTPPRSSSATRSAGGGSRWSSSARTSAGRVVPREERAGHVSRPPAGPQEPSPDLDTPPRSSSATRSADAEFRWSSSAPKFRWSSSARRGTSRARVETSHGSPPTLTGSRHGRSSLAAYSISGWGVPLAEDCPVLPLVE